jgi:hypothetical protein
MIPLRSTFTFLELNCSAEPHERVRDNVYQRSIMSMLTVTRCKLETSASWSASKTLSLLFRCANFGGSHPSQKQIQQTSRLSRVVRSKPISGNGVAGLEYA